MADIDLKRLRYFERIAQDGSLTKAAGVLRIAQPALSRQMRFLEDEVGAVLFSRTARGMRLTEEGEYLLASIAGPIRDLDLAIQNLRDATPRVTGNFAVGMTSGVGDVLARDLAVRMGQRFPDIRLRLVEGVSGSLVDWLARGIIDFAVLETEPDDDRLTDRRLLDQELMLIGPPGPAVGDEPVTFRELVASPLILPSHHLGIRRTLNAAAAASRVTLAPRLETDSTRLALELVTEGLGHTILPPALISATGRSADLTRRPIRDPILPFSLHLASRKQGGAPRGRSADLLVACLAELVVELDNSG